MLQLSQLMQIRMSEYVTAYLHQYIFICSSRNIKFQNIFWEIWKSVYTFLLIITLMKLMLYEYFDMVFRCSLFEAYSLVFVVSKQGVKFAVSYTPACQSQYTTLDTHPPPDKKTKRQKDRKTKRQKDRKTERQKVSAVLPMYNIYRGLTELGVGCLAVSL